MEKYKLFELDIDTDALIKSASNLKSTIDELNKKQNELKKAGDSSSEQFVQNASDLKTLDNLYKGHIKMISQSTQKVADAASREKLLSLAIKEEVSSITEARDQNKILNKLRNETNVTTKEGAEELEKLNAKLDSNNEFIKENADAYLKQKINIGNYKDSIKEAYSELNIMNGGFSGFIERSKEAGGVGKLVQGSLKGMAQGLLGITKASLAFIATPIGVLLAVLVGAFLLVKNAMNRSEEATNKITKVFSVFGGIVNKLLKWLEPLGEFLIDGIVMGFELAGKAAEKAMDIISSGLSFLGFESAAKSVNSFKEEMKEAGKEAQNLADAEAKLEKAQRQSQKTQLDYQKDAEKLRQQRDNENLSITKRIKANEDLGLVLQKQLEEEMRIAELALVVADARIKAEGETKEALDKQAEALTTIADIQERITGQESEQLVNRISLQKEAADKVKEAANKRIELAQNELELLREQRRFNEKNLEEVKFFAAEEIKILKQKLKDKLISETEYKTQVLKLNNDVKDAETEFNNSELERIKEFNDKKTELQQEINLRNIEDANQRAISKAELDYEKHVQDLENLKLAEQEKTELLALLEVERDQVIGEIRDQILEDRLAKELEANQKLIQSDQLTTSIRASLAKTLTDTLTGLLGKSLGAKLASIAIEAGMQAGLVKLEAAAASGKVTANIAAANAAAIAASPLTGGLPFVAANTAQGIALQAGIAASTAQAISRILAGAAVKGIGTIANSALPKAERGMAIDIGGNRHSAGGTKFYGEDGTAFEAEKGEKMFILNRQASAALSPLLSDINQQYGGVALSNHSAYLASGGQVARSNNSNSNQNLKVDTSGIQEAVYQGSKDGIATANITVKPSEVIGVYNENQSVVNGASR